MTEAADLALVDGVLITMSADRPVAEAVAVRDGRIAAVGSSADIRPLIAKRTEVIDLRGRAVVPGLIDCHTHVATDAKDAVSVELRDFYVEVDSVTTLLDRIGNAARSAAPSAWIIGRGSPMQDVRLAEKRFPSRSELDQVLQGHPGYVTFGSHVLIASTEAMHTLGINAATENPRRGLVVKDPGTGEPTGEFRDGAGALFTVAKDLSAGRLPRLLEAELKLCAERGVTSIHDVVASEDEVRAYQDLHDAQRLPVRVQLLIRVVHSDFREGIVRELGLRQGFGDRRLGIGGVKCSVDGGFTGRTAAFSQPLFGDDRGTIRIPADDLDSVVGSHHRAGIRVCVHAIGDKALDMTISSFEKAVRGKADVHLRHRVEHMGNWLCSSDRLARAKAAGLSAVPNPAMLYFLSDEIHSALGAERSRDAFPFRSILAAGVPVGFGSDGPGLWPSDPLRDIAVAVSRTSRSGRVVAADQAITFHEALAAQTTTAAWLGYSEKQLGSIEPGKLADLVVLDQDVNAIEPGRLTQLKVDATIVEGELVHRSAR